MSLKIFGAKGISLMKLYHVMCCWIGVLTQVQNLWGTTPWNLKRQKTSKIWHDLGQLSTLTTNIFRTN